jgi:hypothetical protein
LGSVSRVLLCMLINYTKRPEKIKIAFHPVSPKLLFALLLRVHRRTLSSVGDRVTNVSGQSNPDLIRHRKGTESRGNRQ